jgi:large subunit ribosomal protein L22
MEVRAVAKYVRVQPRKVRIVADEIRGKDAVHSVALLRYHPSKSAKALRKVLVSAIANAGENHKIAPEDLKIATIMIDEGPRLKRMRARAQGRGNRIIKKTSHITVVVEDVEPTPTVRPHGTKAKPRPKLAVAAGRKKGAPASKAAPASKPEVVEEAPVVETAQVEASAAPEVVEAPAIEETAPEAPAAEAAAAEPEPSAESGESAAGETKETE